MKGLLVQFAEMARWMAAVIAGALPVRMWPWLGDSLPLRSAAAFSGILTSCIGMGIDIVGTLNFVFASSASRTETMLGSTLAKADFAQSLANAGPALTLISFLYFPFFTPLGQFATYLTITGFLRG